MSSATVTTDTYGWPEKVLNGAAGVSMKLGLPITNLDVDSILASARRSTGLTDWGDDRFIEVMRELVRLLHDAPITPLAHAFCRSVFIKSVVNRLTAEEWFKANPEAEDIEIKRPVFVVGFPRTGTTVLQNLLALPEGRRALQFWELTAPVPRFADPEQDARRRIAATDRMLSIAYFMAPEMGAVHEVRAQTPEECWGLMANTCAVLNYDFQSGITDFGDFLMGSDMTWVYQEFRRMLKMLLHQRPAQQLVLKCPEHLWFLDSLLEVFPDACIVWPHRDPFDAVSSYCSMMSMPRRVYYGEVDPSTMGEYVMERFNVGINRALEVRDRLGSDAFLDMRFLDIVQDQAGAVRQIHEHFGLEHPADMDAQVERWLASRRADKRGSHVYDAARYGVRREDVHARYADYIQRFQIPLDT